MGIFQNVTIVLIGFVDGTVTKGGGQKNPKILRMSFKYGPFHGSNPVEPLSPSGVSRVRRRVDAHRRRRVELRQPVLLRGGAVPSLYEVAQSNSLVSSRFEISVVSLVKLVLMKGCIPGYQSQ